MNPILNSIKLDYYILKSSDFRRIGIVAAVALVAGFLAKNPPLIVGIIMMIAGFFMSTIFAVVEKNSLNKLYGILPVKKQQTVIGRYILTFCVGIAIAAIALVLALAVSAILGVVVSAFTMTAWLCGSFLVFCLLVSVQFPLYFKYDFSKLAALANLPYIVVFLIGSYVVKKDPALFAQTIKFFTMNPYMMGVVALVGGAVLLALSMGISVELYKNREL